VVWLHLGQIDRAVGSLRDAGVEEAVMAGKVPKLGLIGGGSKLELDAQATRLIESLADHRDDSILRLAADFLESHGIRLLGQAELVPGLLPGAGPLGRTALSEASARDLEFGWPIAKAIAGLDIGQTVVVRDRAVLAVEAVEGTDAAIERAGQLAPGSCVIKVAKPAQDPRFDLPAIGLQTLKTLRAARASALVFEAGATLVLDRDELVALADASGIALLGVGPR